MFHFLFSSHGTRRERRAVKGGRARTTSARIPGPIEARVNNVNNVQSVFSRIVIANLLAFLFPHFVFQLGRKLFFLAYSVHVFANYLEVFCAESVEKSLRALGVSSYAA